MESSSRKRQEELRLQSQISTLQNRILEKEEETLKSKNTVKVNSLQRNKLESTLHKISSNVANSAPINLSREMPQEY